jgi:orotate phosphoribosyltransferase
VTPQERLKALIKEKCVLHGDFVLSSGQRSKIFFDCKRATLDPEGVHLIATLILKVINRLAAIDGRPIDAIGGPTIGADPIVGHVAGLSWLHSGSPVARRPTSSTRPAAGRATVAAAAQPLRAFLVRKGKKDHGTRRLIENDIPKGARVVIVEDVVTTGTSTLQAVRQAEEAGLEVAGVISVVDREQGGVKTLTGYRYYPLYSKADFDL